MGLAVVGAKNGKVAGDEKGEIMDDGTLIEMNGWWRQLD